MKIKLISTIAALALFSGCTQMQQQTQAIGATAGTKTKQGAAIGAAAGGILGQLIGKDTQGTMTGAGIGTIIGSVVGYNMDKQAQEIAKSLETQVDTRPNAEATSTNDIIVTKNDQFVKVTFRDKMMFATNSSTLTSQASYTVNKLVGVLRNYPQTIVQIVGHTDNRGSHSYNMTLSQKRARSVSNSVRNAGVQNSIQENGCSFDKPVAPNTSATNMSLNRRVEIYLYPTRDLVINQCI